MIIKISILIINLMLSKELVLGFGSCLKSHLKEETDILKEVVKNKPSHFFFIGDLFYLDKIIFLASFVPNYSKLEKIISDTKEDPNYINLSKNTIIKGIWDDHDYGLNNSDKLFKNKNYMRKIFLDFLDEDKNSVRYNQKGGIYTYYYVHDRVKVILWDNRFSKDPFD